MSRFKEFLRSAWRRARRSSKLVYYLEVKVINKLLNRNTMYPKFIVNEGKLKTGIVYQHRELANDHSTTVGGGWWYRDDPNSTILLYGRSQVFGPVARNVLLRVIGEGNHDFPGYTFYYSRSSDLQTALSKKEKLI